jgi:hypothetical protein
MAAPDVPGARFRHAGHADGRRAARPRLFRRTGIGRHRFRHRRVRFPHADAAALSAEVRAGLPPGMYEQLVTGAIAGACATALRCPMLVAYQAQLQNGWHDTTLALAGGNGAAAALERAGGIIVATLRALAAESLDAARKYLELLRTGKALPNGQTPVEWLSELSAISRHRIDNRRLTAILQG